MPHPRCTKTRRPAPGRSRSTAAAVRPAAAAVRRKALAAADAGVEDAGHRQTPVPCREQEPRVKTPMFERAAAFALAVVVSFGLLAGIDHLAAREAVSPVGACGGGGGGV